MSNKLPCSPARIGAAPNVSECLLNSNLVSKLGKQTLNSRVQKNNNGNTFGTALQGGRSATRVGDPEVLDWRSELIS